MATNDFFWNSGKYANPTGGDYGNSPWGNDLATAAPEAAYSRYLSSIGVGNSESDFDRWARDQYSRALTGYKSAVISDPYNTRIQPYFNSLGNYDDWYRQYLASTTPGQRGERQSNFAPAVRWMNR